MHPALRKRWIRASEFAEIFEVPMRTVRYRCKTGTLPASKRGGGIWFIDYAKLKTREDTGGDVLYAEAIKKDALKASGMTVTKGEWK